MTPTGKKPRGGKAEQISERLQLAAMGMEAEFALVVDDRPVRHGIGERHAELEDVGAGLHQRAHQRHGHRGRRIARRDVRDERLAPRLAQDLEARRDAGHG